jgi:membrane-associated phospholipid phosphatase
VRIWLSRAADYSRLSLTSAAALALLGGRGGRRAATSGLASVAVTSAVVNVAVKPLGRRRRPERVAQEIPLARQVRMPTSSSFPSGHSAAAFAFATGSGTSYRARPRCCAGSRPSSPTRACTPACTIPSTSS